MEFPTFSQVCKSAREGVSAVPTWQGQRVTAGSPLLGEGTRLSSGVSREVFLLDRGFVCKNAIVPAYDRDGRVYRRNVEANKAEVLLWKACDPVQRMFLTTPFVWARDFSWVVHEEVEAGRRWNGHADNEAHEALIAFMATFGREDLHGNNVGYRPSTGHMVALDYAW